MRTYKTVLDDMRLPMVREVQRLNVGTVSGPEDVARVSALLFGDSADEHVWCFCMNNKQRAIGAFEVSHGTCNASIMNSREIYRTALLLGACGIILCHNHSSGDTTPSETDIASTRTLKDAGNIVGVSLLDHIIIGNGYLSMMRGGYI